MLTKLLHWYEIGIICTVFWLFWYGYAIRDWKLSDVITILFLGLFGPLAFILAIPV